VEDGPLAAASKVLVSSAVMGSLLVGITVKSTMRLPAVKEVIEICDWVTPSKPDKSDASPSLRLCTARELLKRVGHTSPDKRTSAAIENRVLWGAGGMKVGSIGLDVAGPTGTMDGDFVTAEVVLTCVSIGEDVTAGADDDVRAGAVDGKAPVGVAVGFDVVGSLGRCEVC